MRRQRNTKQIKEQGKNPPDQTNEEEIGSLPEKEFRMMIVRMIQNLGNRIDWQRKKAFDITRGKGCWKLSICFLCLDILCEVGKVGYKETHCRKGREKLT